MDRQLRRDEHLFDRMVRGSEDRIAPRCGDLMETQITIHFSGGLAEAIHRGERRRHEAVRESELQRHHRPATGDWPQRWWITSAASGATHSMNTPGTKWIR